MNTYFILQKSDKGEEGVQNPQKRSDVIYGWPPLPTTYIHLLGTNHVCTFFCKIPIILFLPSDLVSLQMIIYFNA